MVASRIKNSKIIIVVLCVIMLTILRDGFLSDTFQMIAFSVYCILLIGISLFYTKAPLSGVSIFIYFYMLFLCLGMIHLKIIKYHFYDDNELQYIALGMTTFVVGSLIVELFPLKYRTPSYKKVKPDTLFNLGKALCIIGCIFGLLYLVPNIRYIFSDYENNRILMQSGNSVLIYLMILIIPGSFVLYECHIRYNKKRIWPYIVLGSGIMLITGSRSKIAEILIGCLMIHNRYKPIKGKTIIQLGIIAVLFVAIYGAFRAKISGLNSDFFWGLWGVISVNDINLNYILKAFPESVPFQYGYRYFMNFLVLLPGSQQDFTMWVKTALKQTFSGGGVTPTIIGEGYINFGLWGIVLEPLVLGFIICILDKKFRKSDYCVPLVILILYLCRSVSGGVANIEIILIWFELVSIFVYWLAKYRIKVR